MEGDSAGGSAKQARDRNTQVSCGSSSGSSSGISTCSSSCSSSGSSSGSTTAFGTLTCLIAASTRLKPAVAYIALQAVLPLRGKILNVERRDDAALYKNQEISALIIALGLGTKGGSSSPSGVEEDPLKGLRCVLVASIGCHPHPHPFLLYISDAHD